jgi:hypothetical protein
MTTEPKPQPLEAVLVDEDVFESYLLPFLQKRFSEQKKRW